MATWSTTGVKNSVVNTKKQTTTQQTQQTQQVTASSTGIKFPTISLPSISISNIGTGKNLNSVITTGLGNVNSVLQTGSSNLNTVTKKAGTVAGITTPTLNVPVISLNPSQLISNYISTGQSNFSSIGSAVVENSPVVRLANIFNSSSSESGTKKSNSATPFVYDPSLWNGPGGNGDGDADFNTQNGGLPVYDTGGAWKTDYGAGSGSDWLTLLASGGGSLLSELGAPAVGLGSGVSAIGEGIADFTSKMGSTLPLLVIAGGAVVLGGQYLKQRGA